ncbi:MAG TPA: FtsX-like permease family protein, partial [Puia sp.]|nr:FtsX-like permease family protein [Puia sp.]
IGIRKVLGASVMSLFTLLSGEFIALVVLAMFIATPLAWWAMNAWVRDFAYRTPMEWWVFIFAGGITLVITLLTVSFQAIKAAFVKPAISLRTE